MLSLLLVVSACSDDPAAGVRVVTVERATVSEVVEAPASVSARATATVNAPADGTIARLKVRDGQQVRFNQVLLRIESPSARRALRQAEKADDNAAAAGQGGSGSGFSLSGARSTDAAAQQAFDRAERAARRIPDARARAQALSALEVSQTQYEAARAQADRAAAQLASGLGSLSAAVAALSAAQRVQTRAAVDAARRTVRALTVRAPIAGTVSLNPPPGGDVAGTAGLLAQLPPSLQSQAGQALGGGGAQVTATVTEGAPVSTGQSLVAVTDASTLSLTAQVDETDVLLVQPGVTAFAELDAVPDATYASEVTAIDPTPTTSARGGVSYVVRLSLGRGVSATGETAPVPRPGMSAVVGLQVRTARGVVAVPSSAVFRDGRRDAVWVVSNGVARKRVVRLGAQGASRVEVLEGLSVDERVVGRGADRVRDGQRLS